MKRTGCERTALTPIPPPAAGAGRGSLEPPGAEHGRAPRLRGERRQPAALLLATQRNDPRRVRALLESGEADVNETHGCHGVSVLMLAARRGQTAVVRMLLKHPGIAVEQADFHGFSALILTAQNNRPEIVDCLLAAGAQVNRAHEGNGAAVLHWAADSGNAEVVRTLVRHPDIRLDQTDNAGDTALMRAAWKGRRDVVACLLVAGARTDVRNAGSGAVALSGAACGGHVEIVRMLLDQPGADVDAPDGAGNTPLMCALVRRRQAVVDCLLAAGMVTGGLKEQAFLSWLPRPGC